MKWVAFYNLHGLDLGMHLLLKGTITIALPHCQVSPEVVSGGGSWRQACKCVPYYD